MSGRGLMMSHSAADLPVGGVLFRDDFEGVDGTALTAHTPAPTNPSGFSWVSLINPIADHMRINTDALECHRGTTRGTGLDGPVANTATYYDMEHRVGEYSSSGAFLLHHTDDLNYAYCRFSTTANNGFHIYEYSNGSTNLIEQTTIASLTFPVRCRVHLGGGALSADVYDATSPTVPVASLAGGAITIPESWVFGFFTSSVNRFPIVDYVEIGE